LDALWEVPAASGNWNRRKKAGIETDCVGHNQWKPHNRMHSLPLCGEDETGNTVLVKKVTAIKSKELQ
jgi:hypothetical protein